MMAMLVELHRRLNRPGALSPPEYLLLLLLLAPSWIYGCLGWLRLAGYRSGLFRRYRARVPVVSVGNLAVGGTGKTPVVDLLTKHFLGQGVTVAVVSRGYGGTSRAPVNVVCAGAGPLLPAEQCGDEPLLLARRNPEAIVVTARRREAGVRHAVENLGARVVILDDGFQHLAVERDLDLLLLDATQPFGNGLALPAGVLREFPSAYRRADLLLLTNSGADDALTPLTATPPVRLHHRVAHAGVTLDGGSVDLGDLKGKRVFAFSGIAHPERFFSALESNGLTLSGRMSLPDHVVYSTLLKGDILRQASGADFLVTTEKDGVKLTADDFPVPCLLVPLELEFLAGRDVLERHLAAITNQGDLMKLSDSLLEILACPQCKGPVSLSSDAGYIVCRPCAIKYPVRDGIPVMLIDEAIPLASGDETR